MSEAAAFTFDPGFSVEAGPNYDGMSAIAVSDDGTICRLRMRGTEHFLNAFEVSRLEEQCRNAGRLFRLRRQRQPQETVALDAGKTTARHIGDGKVQVDFVGLDGNVNSFVGTTEEWREILSRVNGAPIQ